jgi:hypothetical protein
MQSSVTCWAIAVNEFGAIVSTMLALSTFATLFFFVYILHRTLKSRTIKGRQQQQQNHKNNDKHRRKKRKHQNTRGQKNNSGRLKSTPTVPQRRESIHVKIEHENIDPNISDLILNDEAMDHILLPNPNDCYTKINDETVQRILPPLAEDEPLESPPTTGNLLGTTLLSLKKYESQLQTSPRSRTASSSTTDSVSFSMDDQSSCSGRSTPTPISANESSTHPSFVTTIMKQSSSNSDSNGNRVKNNVGAAGTPNRNMNQNFRRFQNSRRSGKKNNHFVDITSNSGSANNSTQLHVPSKRWDALKPSNRIMNNRQQRHGSGSKYLGIQSNEARTIESTFLVENGQISSDERQPSSPENDKLHSPDISPGVNEQQHGVMQPDLDPVLDISNIIQSANALDRPSAVICKNPYGIPPIEFGHQTSQFSGLNPNSPSWTSFRQVGSQSTDMPVSQQKCHPPCNLDTYQSDSVFGVGNLNSSGTKIATERTAFFDTSPQPTQLDMNQRDQFYFNATNSTEPLGYNRIEPSSMLFTTTSDFDFLGTVRGFNGNSELDFANNGASVSTLCIPSVDKTMISTPPTSIGTLYRRSPHHSHVRENPFASSDDDDEDDQIEAKLQELGGQLVGNILDF